MSIVSILILLSVGIGAVAAPPVTQAPAPAAAPAGPKPSIQFEKVLHNFGRVVDTEVLRHDFIVTNTGTATLEILDVRPGCPSCTTALPWDRKVEPGKTGKIPIEFRPKGFAGTVNKMVTVTCNDPAANKHVIQVQATIWKPVDVWPAYVYFMGVEGEFTNDTKTVHITNNLPEGLSLEAPQSSNPSFKTQLKTVKPGKEFELQVIYSPAATATGGPPPQAAITMQTSATNVPALAVTAYAMSQPALVVMPASIRLPAGALAPNFRQPVTIRNNSMTPLKLSDPAVNAEGVTVQASEVQTGKLFSLNISFPTNFNTSPEKPLELTVKTSHPRHPLLRVPFVQPPPTAKVQ